MKYWKVVLESIDWASVEVLTTDGESFKLTLSSFLEADSDEAAQKLWFDLEGLVFTQNTIYGAALPTVEVLMAALAEPLPRFVRLWALDVLRYILNAGSAEDPTLEGRCHLAAQRGVWMLVSQLRAADPEFEQEGILEVLELLDEPLWQLLCDGAEY